MIARRPLRIAILTALFWLPVLHAQTLRLMCEFDGRELPVAGLEGKQPYCMVDGKKVPVPTDATWRLDGDLKASPQIADWNPSYHLELRDIPDSELVKSSQRYEARIVLVHATELWSQKRRSPFLDRWPDGFSRPALAVFAWVDDGKILQTAATVVPSTQVKFFLANQSFQLSEAEARGHGIALLWFDGAFVPPAPRFKDPLAESTYLALMSGNESLAEQSFRSGLKPWVVDRDDQTMLHYCAEAGRTRAVEVLLAAKIDPDFSHRGTTPALMRAAPRGRLAVVDRLLSAGAKVTLFDLPLHDAIQYRHEATALRLLKSKVRINTADDSRRIPLARAIDAGLAELADELSERQPTFAFSTEQFARVLITQAQAGHAAMVRFLLDRKVKPDLEFQGETALIAGARSGDPAIARALIAAGANASQISSKKLTALMVAAIAGNTEYATVLLAARAPTDVAGPDGNTALHLAASADHSKMVQLLLEQGAKHDVVNNQGHTPLHLALARRSSAIVAALSAKGAKLDPLHPRALECLEAALVIDAAAVLEAAIADGWKTDTLWRGTWSALRIAEVCNATECIALLRNRHAATSGREPPVLLSNRELDAPVRIARAVSPTDPRSIREVHPRAIVEVDLIVDSDGTVRFPQVASATDPWLVAPTLEAVRQWVFTQPLKGGSPAALKVRVPVEFPASWEKVPPAAELELLPTPIDQPVPKLPRELRGHTGQVLVKFVVNPQGKTEHVHVIGSALPQFDEPAIEAVKRWTFKPGQVGGKPVACWLTVPLQFR